jgi:hypothetical protein
MTTPAKDKALQYVGDIMDAYKAAEKAGATALGHALECGKHLRSAFNTVEAQSGKGKWKSWCKTNLPDVSEETERVYRRLANAVALKEDFFAGCTSIRGALAHLSKFDPETLEPRAAPTSRPRKSQSGSTATAPDPAPSTDPAVVLHATAADEIIDNIKDDTDKLEGVARQSIIALTPEAVCDALTEAWGYDQIVDLQNRLVEYLNNPSGEARPATTYEQAGLEQRPQT